jgi:hypothetical protein
MLAHEIMNLQDQVQQTSTALNVLNAALGVWIR